ncbi:MAG: bifunctional metallophosphatase/5'-nucleotidase [Halobacteriovoraceae bacterium]|jgi:5'-nucleotidase / UDP-sugar diphosphatase|nr:bifunctional metallophosphatase/5'-nucleotidase [Halobacteriovoraceae bacterium]MBT5094249.1 bifunctional metallophosphatase/5'-nucleotidase [Halobacteriovoraceae bacterium]
MQSIFKMAFILSALFCGQLKAELIQILHTSDMHSFFENSIRNPNIGGYARVKKLIDDQKAEALKNGIRSILLDSGDFMEGTIFYNADRGRRSFNIMNYMGYDAVVIGNHDFLMGSKELSKIVKEYPPQFKLLSANMKMKNTSFFSPLKKTVEDLFKINVGGAKVSIIGLTTDDRLYKWRFDQGKIKSPVKVGSKLAKKLKKNGSADFVFALTHLGLWADEKLVKKSKDIDFVFGGHSHTILKKPLYFKNKDGRKIPVVHPGYHGEYLGKIVLDIEKGRPVKLVSYELLPVDTKVEEDITVKNFVSESRKMIDKLYGKEWLHEVIGHSDVYLLNSWDRLTPWTAFATDAIKESVNADIAFHAPGFGGADVPPGPVTRESIYNAYSRVFDVNQKEGWHVYYVDIYGVILKSVIRFALKGQQPLAFSGITFDLVNRDSEELDVDLDWVGNDVLGGYEDTGSLGGYLGIQSKYRVTNIQVNGESIKSYKRYRVALPEGIVLGGLGISGVVKYLLRKISRSKVSIWEALVNKMREIGTLDSHYGQGKWSTGKKCLAPCVQNSQFLPLSK